jgi:hydroxyacylglutathione hydrolase
MRELHSQQCTAGFCALLSCSAVLFLIIMKIRIEDEYEDVIAKAARGLGLSLPELSALVASPESSLALLFEGNLDLPLLRALAPLLGLNSDKLGVLAEHGWQPSIVGTIEGLRLYNTACPVPGYQAMTVNNYLVYDPSSRQAAVFDTGVAPQALLADLKREGLQLRALFLTHTHFDHVAAYQEIIQQTGCTLCYAPALEPFENARPICAGDRVELGMLSIQARETAGHSKGGTTYVVDGLAKKIALVGDSIFCQSIGKAHAAYAQALCNNREQILSLPASTVLCPGHGPLTTVAEELLHNPFF